MLFRESPVYKWLKEHISSMSKYVINQHKEQVACMRCVRKVAFVFFTSDGKSIDTFLWYRYLYWYQLLPSMGCCVHSAMVWLNSKVAFLNFLWNLSKTLQKYVYYHFKKFLLNILKFLSSNFFFHNFSNVSQELCRNILQFPPKFFIFLVISPRQLQNFRGFFTKLLPKLLKNLKNTSKNILINFPKIFPTVST